MTQRGRKSIDALAVMPVAERVEYPEPPDRLQEDEAAIWRMICASMPPRWFTDETLSVLEAVCVQIVFKRGLDEEVRTFPKEAKRTADGVKIFKTLHRMQIDAGNNIAYLATKLRLTPQSRYDAARANTATKNAKAASSPWEIGRAA
jgi:hypothetical protein